MRIAFFHELHAGGARRSSNEFAQNLSSNNKVDLYIVDTTSNKNDTKFYNKLFFFKFRAVSWNGNDWKKRLVRDTWELWRLYLLHKKIAGVIDGRRYDVVFIEPSRFTQAPFILRFLKTPKVYYCQEPLRMVYEDIFKISPELIWFKRYYEKIIREIRKRIDKKNIYSADLILANSKFTQNNIMSVYGLKSEVSYMGVDTKVFRPAPGNKKYDILYVGAYAKGDGYILFEKVIKSINGSPRVKILASEKSWINDDNDMRSLYTGAKLILCLTSNEPFGLIPLEAAACGIPVIALDSGGYRETILNGKTGYLTKSSPSKIAEKINDLLQNTNKIVKVGKNARENVVRQWTWEKRTRELEKKLVQILKK